MKRRGSSGPTAGETSVKRRRSSKTHHQATDTSEASRKETMSFLDSSTVRQLAEPYRLATARIPFDALTCTWRRGVNRQVNRQHASRLRRMFEQGSLARQAEENYLLVQCRAEAVERMISHLKGLDSETGGAVGATSGTDKVLEFDMWAVVNREEKAEVMAGQHRMEALREYVRVSGSGAKELWWTCIIYDRDKLPAELDIKLRVNRQDASLPDGHGQIWMQLVLASGQNETLFRGKKPLVEEQMREILRLGSERFPVSRLVTLWKNDRWRSMITRWCETEVGRATFNISTWDWMASYRIDNYWFSTFEEVLETLQRLPGRAVENVDAGDWAKLVAGLPPGYGEADVRRLFYPEPVGGCDSGRATEGRRRGGPRRRKGFLQEMGDKAYDEVFRRVADGSRLRFPDVQALLKTTKEEGRIMMQAMKHVVAWVNPNPTVVVDRRENNKPLLREDLREVLRGKGPGASSTQAEAESASITVERRALEAVREAMASFRGPVMKASLDVFPTDDKDNYGGRFMNKPWRALMDAVQDSMGSRFQPPWKVGPADGRGSEEEGGDRGMGLGSSLTRAICALVQELPEVVQDPALSGPQAADELGLAIDEIVTAWAEGRRWRKLEGHRSSAVMGRSDTMAAMEATSERYGSVLGRQQDRVRGATAPDEDASVSDPSEWSRPSSSLAVASAQPRQERSPDLLTSSGTPADEPSPPAMRFPPVRLPPMQLPRDPINDDSTTMRGRHLLPSSPKATTPAAVGDRQGGRADDMQRAPGLQTGRAALSRSQAQRPLISSAATRFQAADRSAGQSRRSKRPWEHGPVAVSSSQ